MYDVLETWFYPLLLLGQVSLEIIFTAKHSFQFFYIPGILCVLLSFFLLAIATQDLVDDSVIPPIPRHNSCLYIIFFFLKKSWKEVKTYKKICSCSSFQMVNVCNNIYNFLLSTVHFFFSPSASSSTFPFSFLTFTCFSLSLPFCSLPAQL